VIFIKTFYVYIIECSDLSLYTGFTTDLYARFEKHKNGKGAKYTRNKGVNGLKLALEFTGTKSNALKIEYFIKSKPKKMKLRFIEKPDILINEINNHFDFNLRFLTVLI
jgi:putative endonuclease